MKSLSTRLPHAAERRQAPRRQPTVGTLCRLTSETGEAVALGLVWNLSTTGVSMLVPRAFEAGAQLEARLVSADAGWSVTRQLRVAHLSRLQTGDYVLGGQFNHALIASEMEPFLG